MFKNILIYSVIAFTVYSVIESKDKPKGTQPMTEKQIGVKLYLFTKNIPQNKDVLIKGKTQTISDSHFDGTKDTKIAVHGFITPTFTNGWMYDLKDEYLAVEDVNVIVVDWSGGNSATGAKGKPDYPQAVANTRVVAQVIAGLIRDLQTVSSIELSSVHIIGHSLGAQISGFVGKELNGEIGRISGLDPAGPTFDGKGPDDRLDASDALFVDATHTNAIPFAQGGNGISEISGHIDFYPNGGKKQPGCPKADANGCAHNRAHDYYVESINPDHTKKVGHQAMDYAAFLKDDSTDCGTNGEKCVVFGASATKPETEGNKYYFKTLSNPPFLGE